MRRILLSIAVVLFGVSLAPAQENVEWTPYLDPAYGFSAELPLGLFEPVADAGAPGASFETADGHGLLRLSAGPAADMDREALEARLSQGAQVGTITYRAGGESWFVLSGYYEPQAGEELTIFYIKVMFGADREHFSAFEISFPADEKPRFEAVVERFEDNFTRPD
jgi:hypothetical protein